MHYFIDCEHMDSYKHNFEVVSQEQVALLSKGSAVQLCVGINTFGY
jgi:hypothetical protein